MRKLNRPICPNETALKTNYKHPDNKDVLIKASHGKCMYCESKVTHVSFGDIEHIQPKSTFPEKEFDWENLGLVCIRCNNAKGNKYDIETPYINPYDEDPENLIIALGSIVKHKQGDERAELTITDIKLNRPELIEKRQYTINLLSKAIDACMRTKNIALRNMAIEELKAEADTDKEYSLAIKTLLQLHGII